MTALNRNPINIDLLQDTKFRVVFERLPGMTFFCQMANFPGLALTEAVQPTPFIDLYVPGEKLIYDTLNITFLVDEEMYAWTELHDWIRGLTFPTDFKEYVDMQRKGRIPGFGFNNNDRPQYGSATLTVHSNKNNPRIRVKFFDVFPTSLSTILFNTQDTAENIVTADASFRFSYYDYERI